MNVLPIAPKGKFYGSATKFRGPLALIAYGALQHTDIWARLVCFQLQGLSGTKGNITQTKTAM